MSPWWLLSMFPLTCRRRYWRRNRLAVAEGWSWKSLSTVLATIPLAAGGWLGQCLSVCLCLCCGWYALWLPSVHTYLQGQRSFSMLLLLSGTVLLAKLVTRHAHVLHILFEISPPQAVLLTLCECVCVCVSVCVCMHAHVFAWVCFDCVSILYFVMDYVLPFGEITRKWIHYYYGYYNKGQFLVCIIGVCVPFFFFFLNWCIGCRLG